MSVSRTQRISAGRSRRNSALRLAAIGRRQRNRGNSWGLATGCGRASGLSSDRRTDAVPPTVDTGRAAANSPAAGEFQMAKPFASSADLAEKKEVLEIL